MIQGDARNIYFPLSPREVLCNKSKLKLQKSKSVVTSMSYDTFILYLHIFLEYIQTSHEHPKYSPMTTIWLHFFSRLKIVAKSLYKVRMEYLYLPYT